MKTVCPDMPGHRAAERLCDACDKPLTKRQQRWCSTECSRLYWENHQWGMARQACLNRSVAVYQITRTHRPIPISWRCSVCGCTTRKPEVNHRTPALGAHSRESCAHHQENLEVLCIPCHRSETRRQHAAGELRRAA